MRRCGRGPAGLALVLATVACGVLPGIGPGMGPGDGMEQVGPRFELGPVPVFGAEGAREGGQSVSFFQTRDGWCFESDGGGMCSGGGGALPGEFTGVGGSENDEETCVQAVTGKQVRRLRVRPGDREPALLPPLAGSEAAPVNVFMACWRPPLPFDDIHAEDATT